MRFPPEKIDEIRSATDIIDLIGSYVKLKKRGKNFLGLCPFHTEKTPSFNVSPERQMYHCFGCGVGGNAFTFVMEMEKISFPEAARTLAERAGISLPVNTYESDAAASETEALYHACTAAARFFYTTLTETNEGKLALEYFRYRGFSDETIRRFGLGYAMNSWEALIENAKSQNISLDMLEKAGLVRKREDGSMYDYFRGRAMFPIFSTSGRVVGFGARKMREDDPLGKYINSPETPLYDKSRILYGLYQAKETIREKDLAILVEGYADLITVVQSGITNVVASSGTALTQQQTQLIARYSKNLVIVYDADSAGAAASLRGLDVALENDLDVRVAELPADEDPDSFVKKNGGEQFQALVDGAISFVDFIAKTYERRGALQTPEGQTEAVRAIVQAIAKMKDEIKRQFYIRSVAEKYKLYESVLYRELERQLPRSTTSTARKIRVSGATNEPTNEQTSSSSFTNEIPAAERDLLHVMLDGGNEIVDAIFGEITPEQFEHPQARALCQRIKDEREVNGAVDAALLLNELEESALKRFVAELMFSKYELSKGWEESGAQVAPAAVEQLAKDALKIFRRSMFERLIQENQRRLEDAKAHGEDNSLLINERLRLIEEKKSMS